MLKSQSLRSKILLVNGLCLILLVILGVVMSRSNSFLNQSNTWVDHTHKVIRQANQITGAAVDMETGMRGYLLAGQEEFLEPYKAGSDAFYTMIHELQETVSDNPPQVKLLQEVEGKIKGWQQAVVEPNIELRRKIGNAQSMNDLAKALSESEDARYLEAIKSELNTMVTRGNERITERQKVVADAEKTLAQAQELIKNTVGWVDHTNKVLAKTQLMLSAAIDMETGARGFFITGQEQFLEPYNGGTKAFTAITADLQKTVSDNPAQVTLIDEIRASITEWKAQVIEPLFAMRRAVGTTTTIDQVVAEVTKARGKTYFDRFRGQVQLFADRERVLLVKRQQAAEKANKDQAAAQQAITLARQATMQEIKRNDLIAAFGYAVQELNSSTKDRLLVNSTDADQKLAMAQKRLATARLDLEKAFSEDTEQQATLESATAILDNWKKDVKDPLVTLRTVIGDSQTMDDVRDIVRKAEGKQYFDAFRGMIANFIQIEQDLLNQRKVAATSASDNSQTINVAGIIITVIIGLGLSMLMARHVNSRMNKLTSHLRSSAKDGADIAHTLLKSSTATTNDASATTEASRESLENAATVASATEEMSTSLSGASSATQDVADKTREVTASVEQALQGIRSVATDAANGESISEQAMQITQTAKENMQATNESVQAIGRVIELISSISERTNLLALNATIEAASAGEAGKGFAVVAGEIKELAQQAATAASEIAEQVTNVQVTTGRTMQGMDNVDNVVRDLLSSNQGIASTTKQQEQTFSALTQVIKEVAAGIDDTSRSLTELTHAAGEIGRGNTEIARVNQTVADNAKRVNEASVTNGNAAKQLSSAAEQIRQIAQELTSVVNGEEAAAQS